MPPRRMDFVGDSDFVRTGDEFLGHFVKLGGLLPDERVLDIGCGIGRMARPLTKFISERGSYTGFDVDEEGVLWCQERYARFGNFSFVHADLVNARYNPAGSEQALEYSFPVADASVEFAFATSVLTHLVTAEAEHYLHETARVLAPGGRALVTFFLLDHGSRAAITQGRATLQFDLGAVAGPMAVVDPETPEDATAFAHDWVRATVEGCGLGWVEAHPGSWRGGQAVSYQDIVVLEKESR